MCTLGPRRAEGILLVGPFWALGLPSDERQIPRTYVYSGARRSQAQEARQGKAKRGKARQGEARQCKEGGRRRRRRTGCGREKREPTIKEQTSGITISTNKYDGKTLNKHVQTSKCDFKTQNAIQKFKSGISKRKI